MIAYINGIQIVGTPEEIERYRQITAEKKTSTNIRDGILTDIFRKQKDNVPDHVKNYGKHDTVYVSSGKQVQAWF